MPNPQLEQAMLDRTAVDKGNVNIAKIQELARAQQGGGNSGLLQKLFAMLRPQQAPPPSTDMGVSEVQHMPDMNLPDAFVGMPNDPRLAEMAERKRYIGQRSYPPVSLLK